ncbi:MAG: lysophospholipid acyltransferase family protein [Acidobacteriia bacterium]|nr:lysophospholipid acyltransferase family protein [Terriglobia bacterium]
MSSSATTPEPATRFTFTQRVALALITAAGSLLVRLIGPTLRYTVSIEEGGPPTDWLCPVVYVFWHRCVIPALYRYRDKSIAVMTSGSFDGEYIARIIEKFGYRAVRGSSTRGGTRALLGMHTEIEAGRSVAFTIDGPLGPRYVAKPGPVLLARNTRVRILAFHCAVERAWVLNSWDRFMIPKPFSRVMVRFSRTVNVPPEADGAALDACHQEMQSALDRVRARAETAFGQNSAG